MAKSQFFSGLTVSLPTGRSFKGEHRTVTTKTSGEDLIKQLTDAWNAHDSALFAALYSHDATVLDPAYSEPLSGREAVEKDAATAFVAFPDMAFKPIQVIIHDNTVVIEAIVSGTHTGPLNLPTGLIPPTRRQVEFSEAVILELDVTGTIRAERRYYDMAGALTQLGMMQ
jgi:steroid delta-isomerase-like uncharacterized protein